MQAFTSLEDEFELVKPLDEKEGVWIAIKKNDPLGERYLARRVDMFDGLYQALNEGRRLSREDKKNLAFKDLLFECDQARLITQVFNHENIVSIVGSIQSGPPGGAGGEKSGTEDVYLVWDYCDASNLATVFKNNPHSGDRTFYLPESLCWHVLRSLVRATSYLHNGSRACINERWGPRWKFVDYEAEGFEWFPILHRAIEPENIFFQHPRGTEGYGLCKLGNFSKAAVAVRHGYIGNFTYVTIGPSLSRRWQPFSEVISNWKKDPEELEVEERPHTDGNDLFNIGAILFRMMTGTMPTYRCETCGCCHIVRCGEAMCLAITADVNDCDCIYGGCEHIPKEACPHPITVWKACPHDCPEPIINFDEWLIRSRYSKELREQVKNLLFNVPKPRRIMLMHEGMLEIDYKAWKEKTEEGRAFRDLEDEMADRWDLKKKKEEEMAKRMGKWKAEVVVEDEDEEEEEEEEEY